MIELSNRFIKRLEEYTVKFKGYRPDVYYTGLSDLKDFLPYSDELQGLLIDNHMVSDYHRKTRVVL